MEKEIRVTHHGRTVVADAYIPEGKKNYPVVIFSHGYNGIGKDFRESSLELNAFGIGAVCLDFCGGSTRSRSDMNTLDMTIFTEKEDLMAVFDEVKSWQDVSKDDIYIFGGSQGGFVTSLVAEEKKDEVKGAILLFPALCIPQNWQERFPNVEDIPEEQELWGMKLGRHFFETIHDYDVFKHIGTYEGPVLFMHGDQDSIVLISYSKQAKELYKDATMIEFPGEGHGFTPIGTKRMTRLLLDFVIKHSNLSYGDGVSPLAAVPDAYLEKAEQGGRVERVSYQIPNPGNPEEMLEKKVNVYLPYGYDPEKKYKILYTLHGGEGFTDAYFSVERNESPVKRVLDHMIANGDIEPMIVAAPTYYNEGQDRAMINVIELIENFCQHELIECVIPAVEGAYSSYAESLGREGIKASRAYRGYTGYSMGALSTWYSFVYGLDYFTFFMPMSGDCWINGTQNPPKVTELLDDTVEKACYNDNDYYIYAVTGDIDIAYMNMKGMIDHMGEHAKHFHFDGEGANIAFEVEPGATHDYYYLPLYYYNGLKRF